MIVKMTPAKEVLLSVEELRCQVGRLRRSVKSLQTRCGAVVSSWGTASPERSKGPDDLLTILADQKDLLAAEERRLKELEAQVDAWIGLLPLPRWRMVLRSHYLDGLDFGQIAEEMSQCAGREFSMNQIYRFHRLALKAAGELWPLS